MAHKVISFRETLTAAARALPRLLNSNGEVNISAVADYCREKEHPVSQPTLQRHFKGTPKPRKVDDKTAKALSAVFHIPVRIWKGDPVTDNEEKALSDINLEDILLARKIAALPTRARTNLLNQIEEASDSSEKLKKALVEGNVTPIGRHRP